MDLRVVNIEKVDERAIIPTLGTDGSAGVDLYAYLEETAQVVRKGEVTKVRTGIKAEIPEGYVGLIYIRSSIGVKHGVTLANNVGVIDSDYRGEIILALTKTTGNDEPYIVAHGDRIAQMVITPYLKPSFNVVESVNTTERGEGGFGSTGKN